MRRKPNHGRDAIPAQALLAFRKTASRLAAVTLAGLAGGCSAHSGSDYSQLLAYARHGADRQSGTQAPQETRAAPHGAIAVTIGNGSREFLVLGLIAGREHVWTSETQQLAIATNAGRIVRTVGLAHDLTGLGPAHGEMILPPRAAMTSSRQQNLRAEFRKDAIFAALIDCTAHPAGLAWISILGRKRHTLRVDEDCSAPSLNWTFENSYWIDPKNQRVWRSIQHIAPDAQPIEIEMLHPPRDDAQPAR